MMKNKDIADLLEVSQTCISFIKTGKRGISLSLSKKLKKIFGGELEDYLHKSGDDAFDILSGLKIKEVA